MDLCDIIQAKLDNDEKLTLNEWKCINLDTCSSFREEDFPNFLKKQGFDINASYGFSIWEAVWNQCCQELERKRIREAANSKYSVTLKLKTSQRKWRAPEINQKIVSLLRAHCQDWVDVESKTAFVGYLKAEKDG